jgi:hypothetical protein
MNSFHAPYLRHNKFKLGQILNPYFQDNHRHAAVLDLDMSRRN